MPNSQQRKYVLAGVNKADYICRCLLDDNYDVEVISPNVALNGEFLPAELRRYQDGLKHKLFTSLRAKSKIGRAFRRIYMQCALFAYLVKSVKREDPLIVYHSLYYCGLVRWVKRITKCKLILEVEEIYSDAMESSSRRREKEVHFSSMRTRIFSLRSCWQRASILMQRNRSLPMGITIAQKGMKTNVQTE